MNQTKEVVATESAQKTQEPRQMQKMEGVSVDGETPWKIIHPAPTMHEQQDAPWSSQPQPRNSSTATNRARSHQLIGFPLDLVQVHVTKNHLCSERVLAELHLQTANFRRSSARGIFDQGNDGLTHTVQRENLSGGKLSTHQPRNDHDCKKHIDPSSPVSKRTRSRIAR